jgi:hypothetical protein
MNQLADAFGEEPFTATMASSMIKKDSSYIQRQICPHINKGMIERLGKSAEGFMQYAVTRKWFIENSSKEEEPKKSEEKGKEVKVLTEPITLNKQSLTYFYHDMGCSAAEIAKLSRRCKDHIYKVMDLSGIKRRSPQETMEIKRSRTIEFRLETKDEKTPTKDSNSITRLEAIERILGKRFNEWKEKVVDDAAVELIRRLIDG